MAGDEIPRDSSGDGEEMSPSGVPMGFAVSTE
jgi:hypothetical protein